MLLPISLLKTPVIFLILFALTILSACGGGGSAPTYSIGGTVAGLSNTGLVLQNNSGNDLTVNADGSFSFTGKLNSNVSYVVSILTQAVTQTCIVSNASGTVANTDITSVSITCVVDDQDAQGLFTANGDGSGTFNGVKKILTDIKGMVFGNLPNQKFIFFDIVTNVLYEGIITSITGIDFTGTATVYNDGLMVDNNVVVTGTVEAESSISMTLEESNNKNFTGGSIEGLFTDEYNNPATFERVFASIVQRGGGELWKSEVVGSVKIIDGGIQSNNFEVRKEDGFTKVSGSYTFIISTLTASLRCDLDGVLTLGNTKSIYSLLNTEVTEIPQPGSIGPCNIPLASNYNGFASVLNDDAQGEGTEMWYAVTNGTHSVFAILIR